MKTKNITYWASIAIIATIVGCTVQFARAWTEPTTTAPNGNVGAPINTGTAPQVKNGSLGVTGALQVKGTVLVDGNYGGSNRVVFRNTDTTYYSGGHQWEIYPSGGNDGNISFFDRTTGISPLILGNNGIVTVNGSRPIIFSPTGNNVGSISIKGDTGGWNMGYFFRGSSNTDRGGFGAFGAADSLNYYYIGPSYTSPYMTLNSAGNVGVGITSPTAKLDISGKVKITDGTQGAGKVLTSDANGLASWQTPAASGGSSQWVTNGTSIYYNNGNVGVGTTSPLSKLSVGSGGDSNAAIYGTGTYGVEGYSTAGNQNGAGVYGKNSASYGLGVRGEGSRGVYGYGNVGSDAVGVVGQGGIYGVYGNGSTYGIYGYGPTGIRGEGVTGVNAWGSDYGVYATGGGYAVVANGGNYGVVGTGIIGIYGKGTSTGHDFYGAGPKSYFAGNVGIGTTSPTAKLDISGKVKITDGTQGAGKVLTSDASGLASWQSAGGSCAWSGWRCTCFGDNEGSVEGAITFAVKCVNGVIASTAIPNFYLTSGDGVCPTSAPAGCSSYQYVNSNNTWHSELLQ